MTPPLKTLEYEKEEITNQAWSDTNSNREDKQGILMKNDKNKNSIIFMGLATNSRRKVVENINKDGDINFYNKQDDYNDLEDRDGDFEQSSDVLGYTEEGHNTLNPQYE